jgi:hypothetical protein
MFQFPKRLVLQEKFCAEILVIRFKLMVNYFCTKVLTENKVYGKNNLKLNL